MVLVVLWALALDQNQVQALYRHTQRWTDLGWSSSSLCCYCMPTSVNDDSKLWARLIRHVSCHIARRWRMCSAIFLSAKMESHAMVGKTNWRLALVCFYPSCFIPLCCKKPNWRTVALLLFRVSYHSELVYHKGCAECAFCIVLQLWFCHLKLCCYINNLLSRM